MSDEVAEAEPATTIESVVTEVNPDGAAFRAALTIIERMMITTVDHNGEGTKSL